jgi:hypothetical protein
MNGRISTKLPTRTSTSQITPNSRRFSLAGSRSQTITDAASTPAATGYDHELIAYSTPIASAAASASQTARHTTSPRGPTSATCSANASASTVNGSASTCAWRSPRMNEKLGNSLIVFGITREGSNHAKSCGGLSAFSQVRTPARLPSTTTSSTASTPASTGPPRGTRGSTARAAAHSVPANAYTAEQVSANRSPQASR